LIIGFQDTVENFGDVFFGTQCRLNLLRHIIAKLVGNFIRRYNKLACSNVGFQPASRVEKSG